MGLKIRVGSFNFENFFSRAILLNRDNAAMAPLLATFKNLQAEIAKATYNQAAILAAYTPLQKLVVVRENKGKLLSGAAGKNPKVVAKGRDDWAGFIDMKRERITDLGQENTIRILKSVNADVVCVVEMEDRPTLQAAGKSPLLGTNGKFPHAMLIDGNDDRGIDVGVLSKYPIRNLVSHVDDRDAVGEVFSRDCLEAEIELPGKRKLFLLCNHLKSQGYGSPAGNDAKRLRQSTQVVKILKARYDLAKDFVVVAGDFNADRAAPNGSSIKPLTSNPGLVDVLDQPGGASWTYAYGGKKQRLDYLLCSKGLVKHLKGVGIERRGIFSLSKLTAGAQQPLPTGTGQKTAASDHAAVYADFDLP